MGAGSVDRMPRAVAAALGTRRGSVVNAANLSAGVTCGLWYVFGGLPIFLSTVSALHLPAAVSSSWLFITCVTGAVSGAALTLIYRQPLAITMTIPGWVFLATVGPHYPFGEIVGANLVAGVLILLLGITRVAGRIMRWLPLPIVLGMFAGSILGYFTGVFTELEANPAVIGAAVAAFLLASAARRRWLPPIGAAVAAGLVASVLGGQLHLHGFEWSPPKVVLVEPVITPAAVLALSVPLAVMSVGIGNVQGLGVLAAKGYRPPVNLVTTVAGLGSMLNALFCGHQATVARNGVAILAADDAGPAPQRYVANLVATVFLLLLALNASVAGSLLGLVPRSLVSALAGLAILNSLIESLKKSVTGALPMGSLFALAIAASPLQFLGIGSTFWALLGGMAVSLLVERAALIRAITAGAMTDGRLSDRPRRDEDHGTAAAGPDSAVSFVVDAGSKPWTPPA